MGISPASLYAFTKSLKSNISEAYKVQVDCLKDSESDSYNKMIWKRKWTIWLSYTMQYKKKLKTASYSEQIQIFSLVPDKWSRMHCSEYFDVFEYLVWTSHEIKNVGGILAKPAAKKRKSYHHWSISSGKKRLWRWQFQ